jgi:hypothetical protein
MKSKNLVITANDGQHMRQLADDYIYIGREVDVDPQTFKVTVLALPRSYKKKRAAETKLESRRSNSDEEYK